MHFTPILAPVLITILALAVLIYFALKRWLLATTIYVCVIAGILLTWLAYNITHDYERQGTVYYGTNQFEICGARYFGDCMGGYNPTNHQKLEVHGAFVEIEEGFVPGSSVDWIVTVPGFTNAFKLTTATGSGYLQGVTTDGSKVTIYGDYIARRPAAK